MPSADKITIRQSYRWCKALCQQSRSSFYASFRLLDKPRRDAMYALYAFARISDDLSDDLGDASPDSAERGILDVSQRLRKWKQQLKTSLESSAQSSAKTDSSDEPADPSDLSVYASLWPALRDAVQRYDIQASWLFDIVDGVSMDTNQQQPADWAELESYCYHVASAVGLACCAIWKSASSEVPEDIAIECGYAFQYTNILRDIAEDARMGRIYLPKSLFDQHVVATEHWLAGNPDGDWPRIIEETASRANVHYLRSWKLIRCFTPDSQRMFSLIWRNYSELLTSVVAKRGKLWQPDFRVALSKSRKLSLFAQHYFTPLYRRLPTPCPSQ